VFRVPKHGQVIGVEEDHLAFSASRAAMADKFDILIQDLQRVRASGSSFGVFGDDPHSV